MHVKISPRQIFWLKVVIHLAALGPLVYTFQQALTDQLGADPVEALLHFTGISALNLVLISLTVSPLAKTLRAAPLIRVRRLVGLYAFTYALTHFLSYIIFELQFDWSLLVSEVIKRPYITVGFVALLILVTLAATSTQWSQRKLGRTWQTLHNLIYLAAPLIALHYIWSVKAGLLQPIIYWLILIGLLLLRKDKIVRIVKPRGR